MTTGTKLAIIGAVVLLDRLTKIYIQTHFSPLDIVPVIPDVFNIVHAENPGAAFSMLADAPWIVRRTVLVAFSGIVMAIVGWMLFHKQRDPKETNVTMVGLALVPGGALGNFWDRIYAGTVTDFIQVFLGSYEYPSFNVADSAIFCGAIALIIDLLRSSKTSASQESQHPTD